MYKVEKETFYKDVLSNIKEFNELNNFGPGLDEKFDLIDIAEMKELLGYSDLRSVKNFCKENNIPTLHLGKKTYTIAKFLQVAVFCQLKRFYPGAEIAMRTIEYDNEEFTNFMENSLNPPKRSKERFNPKAKNSPAAEKLLRKLNEL